MRLLVGVELVVSGLDLFVSFISFVMQSWMSLHPEHPELALGGNLPCDPLEFDVGI